jgi:hypothetical protein
MNIYEEEKLEKRLGEITDQFGYLLLDLLLISLKRLNNENQLFEEFEDARLKSHRENISF